MTFLYVRDLRISSAFYNETLGLPLILDKGKCRIFQISKDGFIGVCQCNDERPPASEGFIVTMVTEDVDGWYERLREKGVQFNNPPMENTEFNIYHFFLSDPDGNQIEIQQFHDSAWPKPV